MAIRKWEMGFRRRHPLAFHLAIVGTVLWVLTVGALSVFGQEPPKADTPAPRTLEQCESDFDGAQAVIAVLQQRLREAQDRAVMLEAQLVKPQIEQKRKAAAKPETPVPPK